MQQLLELDELIYNLPQSSPIVVADRTLIHQGQLGDAMDPRALPKMYFLFSDALFELIPRKRPGRKLTARKARDEFDFSRVYYFQAADLEMREIPPSVMANGFTLVNHADDATWSDLGFYASTPQELRGWWSKSRECDARKDAPPSPVPNAV